MSKKGSDVRGRNVDVAKVRIGKVSGREAWTVTRDGAKKTLVTSSTSAKSMDRAVVKYKKALERLAKR